MTVSQKFNFKLIINNKGFLRYVLLITNVIFHFHSLGLNLQYCLYKTSLHYLLLNKSK